MSSITTEQREWTFPPASDLNEGSQLMDSVCKEMCVQDSNGACTGKLTPEGAQLHSHMRLKSETDWEWQLESIVDACRNTFNGKEVSEVMQRQVETSVRNLARTFHHATDYADSLPQGDRSVCLKKWTAEVQTFYGFAINNAINRRDTNGALLERYLEGLAQRCTILPSAYSARTGPLPLNTLLPPIDPDEESEARATSSFAPDAASRPDSSASTPIDLKNASIGRTQDHHNGYKAELTKLGGPSDIPHSKCSRTIAESMKEALARNSVGVNAEFEQTIDEISRRKAEQIGNKLRRTEGRSKGKVDPEDLEPEEPDGQDVWPKLSRQGPLPGPRGGRQ